MGQKLICGDCAHVLAETAEIDLTMLGDCSACGSAKRTMLVEFEEAQPLVDDEFQAVGTTPEGTIVVERINKSDGCTQSSLASDAGQPSLMHASRTSRVAGFAEEQLAAEALAQSINEKYGTRYAVRLKAGEDSDYADRILESSLDDPKTLNVQIRHFDEDMIAALGKTGEFRGSRDNSAMAANIAKAIERKSNVDPAVKTRTILLLQIPAVVGEILKTELQGKSFDLKGFRGIWIYSFREGCFELRRS